MAENEKKQEIQKARKALTRLTDMLNSRLHEENASNAKFGYLSEDHDYLIRTINSLKKAWGIKND